MPDTFNLPIIQILRHKKSPNGVSVHVLFCGASRDWIPLHEAMEMAPLLARQYLEAHRGLEDYHWINYLKFKRWATKLHQVWHTWFVDTWCSV